MKKLPERLPFAIPRPVTSAGLFLASAAVLGLLMAFLAAAARPNDGGNLGKNGDSRSKSISPPPAFFVARSFALPRMPVAAASAVLVRALLFLIFMLRHGADKYLMSYDYLLSSRMTQKLKQSRRKTRKEFFRHFEFLVLFSNI